MTAGLPSSRGIAFSGGFMSRTIAGLGRLLPILALGVPVLAQGTQSGNIQGEVVDKSGAPISGARVRLTSPALQGTRDYTTDASGHFTARLLPPGEYKIVVSKEGLEGRTITQRVGLEQTFSPRITLTNTAAAVVEVVSANVAVDKNEFKAASNYTKETIDNLPISRSDLLQIAYMAPGVVENVNADRGGLQIRGSMGTGNLFLLDGQNYADNLYGGPRVGIIFDAVEETQILTGALPAEYGDVEGGVVNSVTKSGGDQFTASLRWDMFNPAWNAVKPFQSRASLPNLLSEEKSIQVGGPIIPAKLWFFAAGFSKRPNVATTGGQDRTGFPTTDPSGAGFTYNAAEVDFRREIKITWAINENNTLSANYHNFKNQAVKDYGAGEEKALTNLIKTGEIYGISLRSVLSSNLTLSARMGEKKQELYSIGGGPSANWILYNEDDGYSYGNTIFDPADPQPDNRNNRTINVKLSYFWDGAGSHNSDFGFDMYEGSLKASGFQGPGHFTNAGKTFDVGYIDTYSLDLDSGLAAPATVFNGGGPTMGAYQYVPDELKTNTLGVYVNDKWTVNKNINLQLGLRLDSYDSKSAKVGKVASHGFSPSPRLGVKYDLFGDSVWVAGLSYARYNGRVMESTLVSGSYVNNAIFYGFDYIGPVNGGGLATIANLRNLANYNLTAPSSYTDAALNIKYDKSLKPQTVDEIQLSMSYTFNSALFGSGYLKGSLVNKEWNNLIDYSQGNNGKVTDPYGNPAYVRYWHNNSNATRKFKSMELEGSTTKGAWTIGGNIVWSSLKGNFVGEGRATPGSGQGLDYYTVQNGVKMYNSNLNNPYGSLPGHVPLRMRLLANHNTSTVFGPLHYGFVYRFDSGAHSSDTRNLTRGALNPGLDSSFGSSTTQYLNNERGNVVGEASSLVDMSIQQDLELMKFGADRALTGYVKMDIVNVFNHIQETSVSRSWATESGSYTNAFVPKNPAVFGTANSAGNYAEARQIRISMGLKF
jgi:hypothetical protein